MIKASNFNIKYTVESGCPLTFYSDFESRNGISRITYPTENGVMKVTCKENGKVSAIDYDYFGRYTKASAKREVVSRLGLGHDITRIYEKIDSDRFMHSAISELHGMRVTSNPAWETTLSFLVSQFNNMKRIRLIMKRMIASFGTEMIADGRKVKLFPSADRIARASIDQLRACNTGFRANYIKSVAQAWEDFDHTKLYGMDYDKAKELLVELDGVGDKVADCILLMGYGKMEAFPIDVWVKRVMERVYIKRKANISYIHRFASRRWGANAGYAQQYIYEYGRRVYSRGSK